MKIKEIPMPICELCDRLTIAQLKLARLDETQINKKELQAQINYYAKGVDIDNIDLRNLVFQLAAINGKMWDAEHEIRKGLDDDLGLEEVGRRALAIRNLNRERIAIKNKITDLVGQPEFKDCKMNHASS